MRIKTVGILLLLLLSFNAIAFELSDSAEISLLTASPGKDLYSTFGHTAIRINDPFRKLDWTFNYGLFDYGQPNFYFNFTKGNLLYMVGLQKFNNFLRGYKYENRSIYEQVLNLDSLQKQQMFDFLRWNVQPENRTYLYDYFFDNCSTRPRDVIINNTGGQIIWDSSFIENHKSIRHLTDEYLVGPQPWGDFGIDLAMGSAINKPATFMEYMFLPDYLMIAVENAQIKHGGYTEDLVKSSGYLLEVKPEAEESHLFTPAILFGLLLVIGLLITIYNYKRKSISLWFDGVLLAVVGVMGIVLLMLWLFTTHYPAQWNLNLAWALPSHFIVAFLLLKKSLRPKLKNYFLLTSAILVVLLVGWKLFPQELNYTTLPLMMLLLIRSSYYYRYFKAKP